MSYLDTQTTTTKSPIERYFKWKGGDGLIPDSAGKLKFWDKENKVEVLIDTPFDIRLLGTRASVTGYREDVGNIYSNLISNSNEEELRVVCNGKVIHEGLLTDIKPNFGKECGFTQNLFFVYTDKNGEEKIGSLALTKASLGSWINFSSENKASLYTNIINITTSKEMKKGIVKYKVPVFSVGAVVSDAQVQVAKEFAQVLNEYLSPTETVQEVTGTTGFHFVDELDDQDLPF